MTEAQKYYAEVQKRNTYLNSCEAVSYDDIRRYPDSYKGKNIKLNLVITEAKPDGWISDGDIFAVISGTNNQIAVYDHRPIREPRIMTGDHITVYGTADGLVKMKTYAEGTGILGSNLFAKTLEEKEIPAINVIYTSNDDLNKITAVPVSDEDYYYNKGTELAQKLNYYLEKLDEKIG